MAAAVLTAHAGNTNVVYVQPPPASTPYLEPQGGFNWSFGASGGYLIDAEEEFYSVPLGRKISDMNGLSQFIFLEVGYSELNNDGSELNLEDNDDVLIELGGRFHF